MSPHVLKNEVLQNSDYTANRYFAKIKNSCAARAVIFTKRAFCGLNARFANAVNLIAHDFLAEANRPRRAGFAVRGDWERLPPHRRAFGRESEFGDTSEWHGNKANIFIRK